MMMNMRTKTKLSNEDENYDDVNPDDDDDGVTCVMQCSTCIAV